MKPDYIIIGAGVIGCATALALVKEGAQVTILERGALGGESSWAGGGILSPLLPWDYSGAVVSLVQRSLHLYPEWVDSLRTDSNIDPEYWVSGMRVLPPFDAEKAIQWCDQHGMLYKVKSDGALWLPQVAQVRNPRLLQAMRGALQRKGVQIIEHTEVTGLGVNMGKVMTLTTSRGEYSAQGYIVTAGAWSQELMGSWALRLKIKPVRGQMLLFKSSPGALPHIVLHKGMYLIPRRDGHILVGSTLEDVGFDKGITSDAKAKLEAEARMLLPALNDLEPIQHWAGLRPGSPDNIPTIARHPQLDNLYVNSGHFRYGVTMAPASAEILADILSSRTPILDVDAYAWPAG